MASSGTWREIPSLEIYLNRLKRGELDSESINSSQTTERAQTKQEWLQAWTSTWCGRSDIIEPGYFEGDWGSGDVDGWYLAELPWSPDSSQSIDVMKLIPCNVCDDGELADLENCENCDREGTIWMRLEDTGWNR